jgi:hypothetical protein
MTYWFHQIPFALKQTANLQSKVNRQLFHTMLGDQRIKQNHQNTFTTVSLLRNRFSATRQIHEYYLRIRQLWHFEDERFLPNSPTRLLQSRTISASPPLSTSPWWASPLSPLHPAPNPARSVLRGARDTFSGDAPVSRRRVPPSRAPLLATWSQRRSSAIWSPTGGPD